MTAMSLRRIGIPGTRTAMWGEYLCAFFYNNTHLLDLVVPYIKAGLEDNEFCLWITGEPTTEQEALKALGRVLPDPEEYLDKKQLAIIPSHEWYLSSGTFNSQKSYDNWASRARAAEANGFAGARTTGIPFWLKTEDEWTEFLAYEHQVNRAIETQRVLSLCTALIYLTHHLEMGILRSTLTEEAHGKVTDHSSRSHQILR